ncbi:radical SAM protein [Candidatus Nitromaritima sp. SCGC AAA799-A02]|nr:radical SAM protein [Candidatus Nitromaritima sp. SCGC AAA799-C22]KMP11985.1 radical SAM protein [Candidatus Nitromaritima sp. SCGC AAA799-A02]
MPFSPETIYIDASVADHPLTRETLRRFPDVPVRQNVSAEEAVEHLRQTSSDVFGAGKRRLALTQFKGSFLKKCPGISPGMVCCNYYVVNLLKNCMYDCSYCFLQDFLQNNPLLVAYVNIEDLLAELDAIFTAHPDRLFRVGTGELTDSLALDTAIPYSQHLIPFFNQKENAVLELKTKSDRVENLLSQENPRNVIVSWSLNPQPVIDREEKGTPGFRQRLESARQCAEKGYRIGIHLDPIILFSGWEKAYRDLIDETFRWLSPSQIEWVSLGSFRYRAPLKQIVKERHEDTRLFTGEHVPSKDGKFRYLRPLRNRAYETLRRYLKDRSTDLNVYMCMETREIWEGVTGKMPRSDEKLDQFFDL